MLTIARHDAAGALGVSLAHAALLALVLLCCASLLPQAGAKVERGWVGLASSAMNSSVQATAFDVDGLVYMSGVWLATTGVGRNKIGFTNPYDDSEPTNENPVGSLDGLESAFFARYNKLGELDWGAALSGFTRPSGMTASALNTYSGGTFTSSVSCRWQPALSLGSKNPGTRNDGLIVAYPRAGAASPSWCMQIRSTDASVESMTSDQSSDVYAAGWYTGVTSFFDQGTPITATSLSGSRDGFIFRMTELGAITDSAYVGGDGDDAILSSVYTSGNVFVTGYLTGLATFGTTSIVHAAGREMFLVRYDAALNFIEVAVAGGTGDDMGTAVTSSLTGKIFVSGTTTSLTTTFQPDVKPNVTGTQTCDSSYSTGAFLASYNIGELNVDWISTFSAAEGPVRLNGLSVRGDTVTAVGHATGIIEERQARSPGVTTSYMTKTLSSPDMVVFTIYDPLQAITRFESYGGPDEDLVHSVSTDNVRALAIGGQFDSAFVMDVGGELDKVGPPGPGSDGFVSRLTPVAAVALPNNGSMTVSENSGDDFLYQFTLNWLPSTEVTVAFSSNNDTVLDLNRDGTSLELNLTHHDVPIDLSFRVLDDDVKQTCLRPFEIHHDAVSDDIEFNRAFDMDVFVRDDESIFVLIEPETVVIVESDDPATATSTYQIALSCQPFSEVTISAEQSSTITGQVAWLDGTESLTFSKSNWNTFATATMSAISDFVREGNDTSYPMRHRASSDDEMYDELSPDDMRQTIDSRDLDESSNYKFNFDVVDPVDSFTIRSVAPAEIETFVGDGPELLTIEFISEPRPPIFDIIAQVQSGDEDVLSLAPQLVSWHPTLESNASLVDGLEFAQLLFQASLDNPGVVDYRIRVRYGMSVFGLNLALRIRVSPLPTARVQAIEPPVGPIVGGTLLQVTGRWFPNKTQDIVNVTVGGLLCDFSSQDQSEFTSTRMTCISPPSQNGYWDAPVLMTVNRTGVIEDPTFFEEGGFYRYGKKPNMTVVSPSWGHTLRTTPVVIVGSDLGSGEDEDGDIADILSIAVPLVDGSGSVPCVLPFSINRTASGSTAIGCTMQATASAFANRVIMRTRNGGTGIGPDFAFDSAHVTSVIPPRGTLDGGTRITIRGRNFGYGIGDFEGGAEQNNMTRVEIDGVDQEACELLSNFEIHCTTVGVQDEVPASPVIVHTRYGGVGTNVGEIDVSTFSLVFEAPEIYSFVPENMLIEEANGKAVTVYGKNFGRAAANVRGIGLADVPCKSVEYVSSAELICLPGYSDIYRKSTVVVNTTSEASGDNFGVSSALFEYRLFVRSGRTAKPPLVTAVVPDIVTSKGGTFVWLYGLDMGQTLLDVVDIVLANVSCIQPKDLRDVKHEWNSTQIIGCRTNRAKPHTGDVVVTTVSGGPSTSRSSVPFTYTYSRPEISSIFPRAVPRTGGTIITLKGDFFGLPSARPTFRVIARLDGYIADCTQPTYISEQRLVCTMPNYNTFGIIATTGTPRVTLQLVVNSQRSDNSKHMIEYRSANDLCDPLCEEHADCIERQCVCNRYYTRDLSTDLCDVEAVLIEPVSGSVVTSENDGAVNIGITLLQQPTDTVVVPLSSSKPWEARLDVRRLVFTPQNYNVRQVVTMRGYQDGLRDGTIAYEMLAGPLISADEFYDEMVPTPLAMQNIDSDPVISIFRPTFAPLNGTMVTLAGRNFDKALRIHMNRQEHDLRLIPWDLRFGDNMTINNMTIAQDAIDLANEGAYAGQDAYRRRTLGMEAPVSRAVATRRTPVPSRRRQSDNGTTDDGSDAYGYGDDEEDFEVFEPEEIVYRFRTPAMTKGYHTVGVVNPDGTSVHKRDLIYYSNDCPFLGKLGKSMDEASCTDCPTGAECPGGNRIWPKPGYWTPDELSGYVVACRPAYRCAGGKDRLCTPGYSGDFCGSCSPGFFERNDNCEKCNPFQYVSFLILAIAFWVGLGFAVAAIRDTVHLGYIVFFVLSMQKFAVIGRMVDGVSPEHVRQTYDVLLLFAGEVSFFKPECFANYVFPFNVMFFIRLAFCLLVLPLFLLPLPILRMYRVSQARKMGKESLANQESKFYARRLVRAATLWIILMYQPLTILSFDALYCVRIAGTFLTGSDLTNSCYKNEHIAATVVAILLLIFVTVLWPVLYARSVHYNDTMLYSDILYMERMDALYEPFFETFRFYWIMGLLQDIALSASATFFMYRPQIQGIIGALFLVFDVLLLPYFQPYARLQENFIVMGRCILMIGGLASNFASKVIGLSVRNETIIGWSVVAIVAFSAAFFLAYAVVMNLFTKPRKIVDIFGSGGGGGYDDYDDFSFSSSSGDLFGFGAGNEGDRTIGQSVLSAINFGGIFDGYVDPKVRARRGRASKKGFGMTSSGVIVGRRTMPSIRRGSDSDSDSSLGF